MSELEQLIARYPFWPQAPQSATLAQIARFAMAGLSQPHLTELRSASRLEAAVARVDLPWDTQQLGLQSARMAVIVPPERAGDGRALVARARAEAEAAGYRYLFTRVDARDIATVQDLEANGFRTVDALTMQYLWTASAPALEDVPGIVIREARAADGDALAAISDACLVVSRFHCDPLVGAERARAIYRTWLRNGLAGLNDLTVVAVDDASGEIIGFLSAKDIAGTRQAFGWGFCRIELVAVMERFRGRHVVRALTRRLLDAAPARGWDLVGVGTQNANVRALAAYARSGFVAGDAIFSLRWRPDSP